jgi:DtxR family Mn-dependent transcriptional regulator
MPVPHGLSPSIEEYVQAIHRLSQAPDRVSTTRLAHQLGVKPASVTGMLRRLSELGLITYQRYRSITLTLAGARHARELIRRHRLTERLLTDLVGVPLEEVHVEACRLEHAVSPELEKRIATKLGAPEICPHGNAVDASAEGAAMTLVEAPLRRTLTVVRLTDESPAVVRYLAERRLLPGAKVEVKLREPVGDGVVLDIDGETQTLSPALAATILVGASRRRR